MKLNYKTKCSKLDYVQVVQRGAMSKFISPYIEPGSMMVKLAQQFVLLSFEYPHKQPIIKKQWFSVSAQILVATPCQ